MPWSTGAQVATFLRQVAAENDAEAKRIGRLVASLRLKQGWSQETLAHESGVSVSTVSRAERGVHDLEAENVRKLASALGVEPSTLTAVPAEVETQFDRIERKLDELLTLMRGDTDAGVVSAAAPLLEVAESQAPPAPGRRRNSPGAGRRKPA